MSATPPVAEWTTTTPPRYAGINLALRARQHIERDQAHDRRRPLHRPVLRNGRWRGLRLTFRNSTSTPLARPRYSLAIPSSLGVRPRSRFATTNTRRETSASRTTNAPDRFVREAAGRVRASGPLLPRPLSRPLLFVRLPATSLRKRQS